MSFRLEDVKTSFWTIDLLMRNIAPLMQNIVLLVHILERKFFSNAATPTAEAILHACTDVTRNEPQKMITEKFLCKFSPTIWTKPSLRCFQCLLLIRMPQCATPIEDAKCDVLSLLHTIHEQWRKRTNGWNFCKIGIVCREWFVMIHELLAKWVHRSRWCFDEYKELFSPYSRIFSVATHICKNCCLWRIVCKLLFVTFRKAQFFLWKSGFIIVSWQWWIVCSGL